MDRIDDAIEEMTTLLIKQDVKDKRQNKKETVLLTKVDLYKLNIKMLKLIKKYL